MFDVTPWLLLSFLLADPFLESNDTNSTLPTIEVTTIVYNDTMATPEPPQPLVEETELSNSSEIMLYIAGKRNHSAATSVAKETVLLQHYRY